ncbi:hypothetical protein CRE_12020 [Caenorhabditis remanei]|uniref:F-box C protein n=1 Tax=Caenorhabditis remanei TaxID=31234 RepID=E3MPS5_CAERE|nr:hypothetical protein CRE_12020 [Caenorhabditis remanei]
MNRRPPLSYESLKSVLGQMNANTRFRLFSRIPSIRPTDKVVPLRIQQFSADNNKFKLNNTEYEVGIYKKYPPGMTPPKVQEVNNAGGLISDLDQHGFVDQSGRNVLTPGDVDLRDGRLPVLFGEPYQQQDERIPDLEKKLNESRRKIEFVESFGPIRLVLEMNPDHNGFQLRKLVERFLDGTLKPSTERVPEFERAQKMAHDQLSREIKNCFAKLQPFYSRRDGLPVPYESFIQLTVSSRTSSVSDTRSLFPLLDAPLEWLCTVVNNDEDCECSILQEARYLEVLENYPYQIRTPVVLNLQNLNFHKISRIENTWSVEDFLLVIKNWIESGKKVGSCYSFGTSEHVKNTILGKITEAFKNAETEDAFISIPTRFNNQVKVSIEERQRLNRWVVKFEVLPVKRATQ